MKAESSTKGTGLIYVEGHIIISRPIPPTILSQSKYSIDTLLIQVPYTRHGRLQVD